MWKQSFSGLNGPTTDSSHIHAEIICLSSDSEEEFQENPQIEIKEEAPEAASDDDNDISMSRYCEVTNNIEAALLSQDDLNRMGEALGSQDDEVFMRVLDEVTAKAATKANENDRLDARTKCSRLGLDAYLSSSDSSSDEEPAAEATDNMSQSPANRLPTSTSTQMNAPGLDAYLSSSDSSSDEEPAAEATDNMRQSPANRLHTSTSTQMNAPVDQSNSKKRTKREIQMPLKYRKSYVFDSPY